MPDQIVSLKLQVWFDNCGLCSLTSVNHCHLFVDMSMRELCIFAHKVRVNFLHLRA